MCHFNSFLVCKYTHLLEVQGEQPTRNIAYDEIPPAASRLSIIQPSNSSRTKTLGALWRLRLQKQRQQSFIQAQYYNGNESIVSNQQEPVFLLFQSANAPSLVETPAPQNDQPYFEAFLTDFQ